MPATEPSGSSALARAIAQAALLRGTFTLRSGRTSSYYLDKYLFSTRPELLRELALLYARRIQRVESRLGVRVARLAGAELGGIPLATATALETGLPTLFVRNRRKDYGTGRQVEGRVDKGDVVVLLEDVATTGGQALEAVESLRQAGADVRAVIAAIDRLEGARAAIEQAGLVFDSLFTREDLGIRE
jgi:orotate phosphoribosyltransferase